MTKQAEGMFIRRFLLMISILFLLFIIMLAINEYWNYFLRLFGILMFFIGILFLLITLLLLITKVIIYPRKQRNLLFDIYVWGSRVILIMCVPVVLVAVFRLITTEPIGYCSEKKDYLTDEKIIEIALNYEAESGRMNLDGSEESIHSFRANNPNCCQVLRGEGVKAYLRKALLGDDKELAVHLVYETNDIYFNQSNTKYFEIVWQMNACGHEMHKFFSGSLNESGYNLITQQKSKEN